MFTRRARRNYRTAVFTAVIVCLCILIVALAWPETPTEASETGGGLNPDYQPGDETRPYADDQLPDDTEDSNAGILLGPEPGPDTEAGQQTGLTPDGNLSENEENSMNQGGTSYYLVKRAGNEIAVFWCDSHGNMVQLETTEILYEMLGPEDQKLFDQGIQVANQEELGTLLQDFEG